ncbi:hypothetical protein C8R43DRAFT_131489 [Mycena crocata]|nr:hypothetical protein C8R43DRAFT_131489 [Mycena crocata]
MRPRHRFALLMRCLSGVYSACYIPKIRDSSFIYEGTRLTREYESFPYLPTCLPPDVQFYPSEPVGKSALPARNPTLPASLLRNSSTPTRDLGWLTAQRPY